MTKIVAFAAFLFCVFAADGALADDGIDLSIPYEKELRSSILTEPEKDLLYGVRLGVEKEEGIPSGAVTINRSFERLLSAFGFSLDVPEMFAYERWFVSPLADCSPWKVCRTLDRSFLPEPFGIMLRTGPSPGLRALRHAILTSRTQMYAVAGRDPVYGSVYVLTVPLNW